MKLGVRKGEKGFTLIEIIIVLAVMGILAAVVVPNVSGYIGRSKERGWEADRNLLQASVDSWRTDISKRTANPWPTLGGLIGTPTDGPVADGDFADVGDKDAIRETGEDLNSFIDIGALATDGYLKSAKTVKSADKRLLTTATNTVSGSYGWFIDSTGVVDAICWVDADNDTEVDAGETTSGLQPDVYP